MDECQKTQRVAIVGSGLAGLTTAYLLAQDPTHNFDITIFESAQTPSLDSASVTVRDPESNSVHRIDLPMRSFAGGYYRHLKNLYDHLGVPYSRQKFLFSFTSSSPSSQTETSPLSGREAPYFHHPSNLAYLPPRPTGRSLPRHWAECFYLLFWYAYFALAITWLFPPRTVRSRQAERLDTYLARIRIPPYFQTRYLLPLLSSVATCSHDALLACPASDVAAYKRLTHRQPHLSVRGGVQSAQARLVEGIRRETEKKKKTKGRESAGFEMRMGVPVTEVKSLRRWSTEGVKVSWVESVPGVEGEDIFDKVVLAVPPNVACKLHEPLRELVKFIPTVQVTSLVAQKQTSTGLEVVEESEASLRDEDEDKGNEKLQPLVGNGRGESEESILFRTDFHSGETEAVHTLPCGAQIVTCPLNSSNTEKSPYEPRTLHSVTFTRVLRTARSLWIVNTLFSQKKWVGKPEMKPWSSGDGDVYLVGGWCWDGMVLLEGCVVSAMRAARQLGARVPWEVN